MARRFILFLHRSKSKTEKQAFFIVMVIVSIALVLVMTYKKNYLLSTMKPLSTLPSLTTQQAFDVIKMPAPDKCSRRKFSQNMDIMKMPYLPFETKFKNPCWVDDDGQLHCIPYLVMVGVAKCGTTDLFKRITLHPDFVGPTIKEPNWLSTGLYYRNESLSFYTRTFQPLVNVLQNDTFGNERFSLITGEASIGTFEGSHFWQCFDPNKGSPEPLMNNPQYIYHINRNARIMINVRNPTDRLWSEYLAFATSSLKSAEIFHKNVQSQIKIYTECFKTRTIRSCVYDKKLSLFATRNESEREEMLERNYNFGRVPDDIIILRRGIYHVFIRDYMSIFPANQILVQDLEDISVNRKEAMRKTFSFLDLRALNKPEMENKIMRVAIKNPRKPADRKVGDMLPETRLLLNDFYRPHNEEFAKLMGDPKFLYNHWKRPEQQVEVEEDEV